LKSKREEQGVKNQIDIPISEGPIKHEFLSDERIAEMFPNADFAAKVRVLRDAFRLRHEEWQLEPMGTNSL